MNRYAKRIKQSEARWPHAPDGIKLLLKGIFISQRTKHRTQVRRARSGSGRSTGAPAQSGSEGRTQAPAPFAADQRTQASSAPDKRNATEPAATGGWRLLRKKDQFRLALCGHKAMEAGAVCLLLMVQGQLAMVTSAHFEIAAKTGLLAVSPALGVTFTGYARHFANRWISSAFLGICTFFADSAIHASHYAGKFTEAALTGLGAFAFSILVSYTPIGKRIDHLAGTFPHRQGASA